MLGAVCRTGPKSIMAYFDEDDLVTKRVVTSYNDDTLAASRAVVSKCDASRVVL